MGEQVKNVVQDTASVLTLGTIDPYEMNKSAPAAAPEKKLVMPIADERTAREARRRAIVKATSRRGRASTILTERETLG